MAYRLNTDDEDENSTTDSANTSYTTSAPLSGTGVSGSAGATGNAKQRATSSGSFQNLIGFLNANKEGADKLATGVTNNINTEVGQADTALDTAKTGFQNDVKSGTTYYDQSVVDKTIANPIAKNKTVTTSAPADDIATNMPVDISKYPGQNTIGADDIATNMPVDISKYPGQNTIGADDIATNMPVDISKYPGQNTIGADDIATNMPVDISKYPGQNTIGADEDTSYLDTIKKLLSAQYSGPTDFRQTSYYQPAANEINDVSKLNELGKTDAGRQQLLSNLYANPAKNVSQNFKYDNLLLGKSNNFSNVLNAIDSTELYADKLNTTVSDLNAQVAPAQQTTSDTAAKAKQQLTAAQTGIQATIDKRVSDRINQETTLQQTIKDAIANKDFTALKTLGYSDTDINNMTRAINAASFYDVEPDLSAYIGANAPEATYNKYNQASTDEAARWQALNNLTGGTSNYITPQQVISEPGIATSYEGQKLINDTTKAVADGLLKDAAQREVDMGNYASLDEALADATKQMQSAVLKGGVEGAAAGFEIAGWVGAIIGAVVGGVAADFQSGTLTDHAENQWGAYGVDYDNPAQLAQNPWLALADKLGISSSNFFVQAGMPASIIGKLFGGGDTQGTKWWKSYNKLSGAEPGRYFTPEQMDNLTAFSFGETAKGHTGNKQLIDHLGAAFGISGFGSWGADSAGQQTLSNLAKEAIAQAQSTGTLPADSRALSVYNGNRVWAKVVAPYIDAKIGTALGNPNYKGWSTDTGMQARIGQDLVDNLMATGQIPSYTLPTADRSNTQPIGNGSTA